MADFVESIEISKYLSMSPETLIATDDIIPYMELQEDFQRTVRHTDGIQ